MGRPVITPRLARQVGTRLGVDWNVISPVTLARGMRVELEHGKREQGTNVTGDDLAKTAKIALAHLEEREDYYGRLAKVEEAPGGKRLGVSANRSFGRQVGTTRTTA
jgi:hypothetical protein